MIAAGFVGLLGAGALLAQTATTKTADPNAAAVARGKTVFQQKCSVCHYDNSEQKKIGPGLKGLSKRGTFSVNGNKITDENLKAWIELLPDSLGQAFLFGFEGFHRYNPFGTWQYRYIDWFRDLGFLQKPGVETKAAKDIAAFMSQPARAVR